MMLQPTRWCHLVKLEVETLRSFSAPLGTPDGGPEPLDNTFLRRQNTVDHVTHHEMEQEKCRRHLELQELIRKPMKEKEQAPRTEQEQMSISVRSYCNSEVGDNQNEPHRHIAISRRLPTMGVPTAHWRMKEVLRQYR